MPTSISSNVVFVVDTNKPEYRNDLLCRAQMNGPCYKCREMGHLMATCQQTKLAWYPFEGSVHGERGIDECMSEWEGEMEEDLPNNCMYQEGEGMDC